MPVRCLLSCTLWDIFLAPAWELGLWKCSLEAEGHCCLWEFGMTCVVPILACHGAYITFFKGGPADPSEKEKEHPTASKIHATLDSCPL
jgi:hypothetical protein